MVDGDSGHGNFNNARRFAIKLARCGAAGVCLEDKLFPKTNSFRGHQQPLADVVEFSGKIAAAKDATNGHAFAVIARTEALVSELGMTEALTRAHAYHAAGADAILVHSKHTTGAEVIDFARQWDADCPLIVVPTTYPDADPTALHAAGIAAAIWANQSLRASARAMIEVCRLLQETGSPRSVTGLLASLPALFEILDYDELDAAERRYLPASPR